MAFRALLSQPRNAAACSADPAVAVSTSGGGNALTSFLNSVTLDPLRTRQLMDGYDLGMVAHSAPAEGTDPLEGFGRPAFPPDFLDESSSQKPINLHAPHPVSVGQLEAAWLPRDGSTLDTEKRAFHGLGGPETLHFPPALGTTEGTSTSTTTSGNSTISSHNQISQLHSFPSYQFTTPSSSSPLPSFSSPSPPLFSSTSSLPPVYYPSAPVFSTDERSTYASHQRFHENFSWADEFNVFSQGEKCFHPETEGLQQRKIVPLPSSYGGVSSSSSTGAKETAGEASSAKQQLAEKTTEPFSTVPAPASASLTPSFDVPLYPLTAYPNCPPPLLHELPRMPVPFRELEQQRRRALEAASLAQAAVGIPTVPREAQSSNKVEGLRKEEAEEQKSFITETEKSKDSSKGPCFDQRAAQEMLENLKAMGQEKMEQSEFVHFIRQLASGHLSLVDGQLRDSAGQSVDWNTYVSKSQEGLDHETQRQENGEAREDTKNSMRENKEIEEEKNSPASTEDAGSFERSMKELENAWQRARDNGEIDEEEFQLFKSVFDTAGLSKAFGDAATDEASLMDGLWAPDEQTQGSFKHDDLLGGGDEEGLRQSFPSVSNTRSEEKTELKFSRDNPYLKELSPLAIAQRLLAEGRLQEAVKALEAEVTLNPQSSEGWRLLGEALADSEQDLEAIACLQKGHDTDPYNLDSLLALGVSLTNELDLRQALTKLREWLVNHDEFCSLPGLQEKPPENLEDLKRHVSSLFKEAASYSEKTWGGDVHFALGVLHNIDQNFDKALYHFAEALKFSSGRRVANLWNKIGATLANSGRSAAALLAYQQTLAMRPNYPRAWTNLGVAHANLDQVEPALRCYLTALVLNPAATHLWYYVRSAVIALGKFDWLGLAENRDLKGLVSAMPPDVAIPKGVDELLRDGTGRKPEDDATLLRKISQIIS